MPTLWPSNNKCSDWPIGFGSESTFLKLWAGQKLEWTQEILKWWHALTLLILLTQSKTHERDFIKTNKDKKACYTDLLHLKNTPMSANSFQTRLSQMHGQPPPASWRSMTISAMLYYVEFFFWRVLRWNFVVTYLLYRGDLRCKLLDVARKQSCRTVLSCLHMVRCWKIDKTQTLSIAPRRVPASFRQARCCAPRKASYLASLIAKKLACDVLPSIVRSSALLPFACTLAASQGFFFADYSQNAILQLKVLK